MMNIKQLLCHRIWRCDSKCYTLARHFWKFYKIKRLYQWCKKHHSV